ncbi:MAG: 50S ribosomal protein L5 [bacterium]|jgi:large subunit ribosomal protein L5
MLPRLREQYDKEVKPGLVQRFNYKNVMAVPRLKKIVISMGMGKAHEEQAKLEMAQQQLGLIAGQKAVVTKATKSISNFKLREGLAVGLKVTLRGHRMWEFFDRLVTLAIPRVKDFRGLNPSGFDGRGNYNMGLVEQSVFSEVNPDSVTFIQGMNIAFQTTGRSDEEARELLRMLGMPFRAS